MKLYKPKWYQKSIYDIDYHKLKEKGIKYLIFDLDNTLVPVKAKEPSKQVKELFSYLDGLGFFLILMSNSPKARVEPFKEQLNIDSCYSSKKPLKIKYKKILKTYGYDISEVACIGDQIMTDIWGANRMGFTSIFLDRLTTEDFVWTKLNRLVESAILKYFHHKKMFTKGEYYE